MHTISGREATATISFRVPWSIYEEAIHFAEALTDNLSEIHRLIYTAGLSQLREQPLDISGQTGYNSHIPT